MQIDVSEFIEDFCQELEADPEKVKPNSQLNEIPQWDSLGMVRFLLLCDEKYDVQMPASIASQATTVADLKHKLETASNQ